MLIQSWMSFIILKLTTFSLGCYAALRAMKIGSSNPSMGNRWKLCYPSIRLMSLCSSGQARKKEMSFHCLSGELGQVGRRIELQQETSRDQMDRQSEFLLCRKYLPNNSQHELLIDPRVIPWWAMDNWLGRFWIKHRPPMKMDAVLDEDKCRRQNETERFKWIEEEF